ncbi:unnamed protein product [Paramecium sonneborni]|uniref:Uncharacterized protein n=1 Tax=Paramecium sonneborni TaxID=65129 RepID=A0A8S1PUA0_9CILI|nr:unnamed protein product [Paramecium sonneborni]
MIQFIIIIFKRREQFAKLTTQLFQVQIEIKRYGSNDNVDAINAPKLYEVSKKLNIRTIHVQSSLNSNLVIKITQSLSLIVRFSFFFSMREQYRIECSYDHKDEIKSVCYHEYCTEFQLNCFKCLKKGIHPGYLDDVEKINSLIQFIQNKNNESDNLLEDFNQYVEINHFLNQKRESDKNIHYYKKDQQI